MSSANKVLLIGWDAADWRVINPLVDAGKMPNLERFINEGVIGNLASLNPPLSPMVWTSIATGKRPFKHGVLGFTEPEPQSGGIRPVTNLSRKTKALWNILNQEGRQSNVVGWWPSHPAEPINGVMVSNHYQQVVNAMDKPWPVKPGTIHPARLIKNLAELRVHPEELTEAHILPFVPRAAEVDQNKDKRLSSLGKIIADCSSIHAAATALIQLEPWDFMAVYYDAIDHFSHGFMRYHPPRRPHIPEKDFELYNGVVEGGYRFHDMMLGVLLQLAGPDTTVIIVSDHGFHPDHLRPVQIPREPAGPAAEHRHYGIFAMRGPGVRKDERIYGASLLDICPTILTALGLPVGEDMDGKPLINVFEETPALETIPSWDDVEGDAGTHPPDAHLDPMEAQEAIDQLVALGYIDKPGEDREKAAKTTVRELQYNLARSYLDAGRRGDALPILEQLLKDWPDEYRFGILLVSCYQAADRLPEARKTLEELFERKKKNAKEAQQKLKEFQEKHKDGKPEDLTEKERHELRNLRGESGTSPYGMHVLMGSLCFAEGHEKKALFHLTEAQKANPNQPGLYRMAGEIFLKMKQYQKAEESYAKVLEFDPDDAAAHVGLCQCYTAQRFNMQAASEALSAVGLIYHNPIAHHLLGVALHRMGRIPRAIEALQVAIAQNPNFVKAHKRLAYIYEKRLKNQAKADEHKRLADEAKQRIRAGGKAFSRTPTLPHASEQSRDHAVAWAKADIPPYSSSSVVIVSGLPRSGTSMMMQMLKAGGLEIMTDEKRIADEDNPRGYYEFEPIKRLAKDRACIGDAKGKAVKVIAQLLPRLPPGGKYRILFMDRDIDEVVASQQKMLKRLGRKGAKLPPEKLAGIFKSQLRQVLMGLSAREVPTLHIAHRDCINDPSAAAVRVNAFLGGTLNEDAMAEVIDPSLYRQRKS